MRRRRCTHLPSHALLHPRRDAGRPASFAAAAALPLAREPVRPGGKGLITAIIVALRLGLRELGLQRRGRRQQAMHVQPRPGASIGSQVSLQRQKSKPTDSMKTCMSQQTHVKPVEALSQLGGQTYSTDGPMFLRIAMAFRVCVSDQCSHLLLEKATRVHGCQWLLWVQLMLRRPLLQHALMGSRLLRRRQVPVTCLPGAGQRQGSRRRRVRGGCGPGS